MRAVNLIPAEAGRGGRGATGIGAYVVLGVLGLLLVGVLAYVLTNNTLVDRRAELASLQTQAHAVQAQADATRPYREFATLAQARVQTVRQLGVTRFDWQRAFDDLARVIPDDVWLTSLLGTVAPGVSVEGAGSGDTGTIRSALPNPAIELSGCTTGHDEVARLISRLRLMTGVTRVALADSAKADASSGASGSDDCRYGHDRFPQFGIVVFFAPLPAAPSPSGTASAGTPAVATAPSAAGGATPAASTTPAPSAGSPAAGAAASGSANGSDVR